MNRAKIQIGSIFDVLYGRAATTGLGNIPVIGSSGVYGYTSKPLVNHPTIVVGRKGSAGTPWLIEEPCHPSDTTFYLVPKTKDVSLSFFYFALKQLAIKPSDDIIPSLKRNELEAAEIPRFPIPEQKAIATLLSKIQCATEIQDKTTSTLKELKTATMAKFFREGLRGEPLKSTTIGEMPKSWVLVPISNYFLVGNGSTPSRKNSFYWEGGSFPWITSKKVHDIFINQAEEYVTALAKKECHLPLVPKGSLVVAITGQGKTLGNVAKLEIDTCINQHLAYFTPKNEDVESNFLLAYLQTCYKDLRQAGSSGGSTKGALTCSFLATYLFPLPKRDEQIEIAGAWQNITARISISEQKKTDLVSLFQATLHQLMNGDLRVNEALEYLNEEIPNV